MIVSTKTQNRALPNGPNQPKQTKQSLCSFH